jgi:GGDEF domain-containing protein
MKPLLTPGFCLVALAILLHTGVFTPAPALLLYAFFTALIAGLLLAWRFHSSRIFFALLALFLSERAILYFTGGHVAARGPGSTVLASIGLLLPLNFVLLSLRRERGFTFPTVAPAAVILFIESVVVAVLCRPDAAIAGRTLHRAIAPQPLPLVTWLAFTAALTVLLIRFALYRKPAESGLLWALCATCLALRFGGIGRIPATYFAAAALMLAVAVVETSYLLAYRDELTQLPSRRAFQESLLRLAPPYSIAMVDIDHFKRCNDTYGHDVGDEVLRMVAGRLARVTGGGKAYRCGGEEFAVVFAGKTASEVMVDLEELRARIESSSFRLRGQDRRHEPRGPDRRVSQAKPGRAAKSNGPAQNISHLSVTASIGVATSGGEKAIPEDVIKAADKALYRAKAGGRNRIETDALKRRKAREKSA